MTSQAAPRSQPIDWDAARRRSAALVRPGPTVERAEAQELVAALRVAAQRAPGVVGEVTGLPGPAEAAAQLPVLVVDRPRWAAANVEMFADLAGDQLPAPSSAVSARVSGEQLGVLLSMLASRVLGQFDPFTPAPGGPGRLLLVAPNVLHVERALALDPGDFRLWVCLHEQTHAVQFTAAPWLPGHLRAAMTSLMASLAEQEEASDRLRALLEAIPRAFSGDSSAAPTATSGGAIMGAVLHEEERLQLERVLAVMALLEGHADVVMDEAGPQVIRTVAAIRRKFEARRDGQGWGDKILRRLLGLDAKLAQYREGAAFVRGVMAAVGHEGLNAVWTGPEQLPQPDEIADPDAWVRRVHG